MSGLPINDLAKAIADATGWVQHIAKLNAALKPLVSGEVNLDTLSQQLDDAQARLDGLAHDIKLREDVLASVNERITLADDARKQQIDADLAAYKASIDSKQRQLDAKLEAAEARLDDLNTQIHSKEQVLGQLTNEIADTNRQLSQVKADAASVIAKLTAAVGGSANVDPK